MLAPHRAPCSCAPTRTGPRAARPAAVWPCAARRAGRGGGGGGHGALPSGGAGEAAEEGRAGAGAGRAGRGAGSRGLPPPCAAAQPLRPRLAARVCRRLSSSGSRTTGGWWRPRRTRRSSSWYRYGREEGGGAPALVAARRAPLSCARPLTPVAPSTAGLAGRRGRLLLPGGRRAWRREGRVGPGGPLPGVQPPRRPGRPRLPVPRPWPGLQPRRQRQLQEGRAHGHARRPRQPRHCARPGRGGGAAPRAGPPQLGRGKTPPAGRPRLQQAGAVPLSGLASLTETPPDPLAALLPPSRRATPPPAPRGSAPAPRPRAARACPAWPAWTPPPRQRRPGRARAAPVWRAAPRRARWPRGPAQRGPRRAPRDTPRPPLVRGGGGGRLGGVCRAAPGRMHESRTALRTSAPQALQRRAGSPSRRRRWSCLRPPRASAGALPGRLRWMRSSRWRTSRRRWRTSRSWRAQRRSPCSRAAQVGGVRKGARACVAGGSCRSLQPAARPGWPSQGRRRRQLRRLHRWSRRPGLLRTALPPVALRRRRT